MPIYNCAEYETRILEYDELGEFDRSLIDAHLATCDGCHDLFLALTAVDLTLSRSLRAFAVARPVRPSVWPLVLDFAGWASLIAILLVLALAVAPQGMQEAACWFALGGATVVGSAYFGFVSWRESRG